MNMQYHVDLMAIVIHERHEDFVREAEIERLLRKRDNENKPVSRPHKGLGYFIPKFNALRHSTG